MSKIKLLTLLIFAFLLHTQSYACGGCQDGALAGQVKDQVLESFEELEDDLDKTIEKTTQIINNEIIVAENANNEEMKKLNNMTKENALFQEKQIFLLKKINALQGEINTINGVE